MSVFGRHGCLIVVIVFFSSVFNLLRVDDAKAACGTAPSFIPTVSSPSDKCYPRRYTIAHPFRIRNNDTAECGSSAITLSIVSETGDRSLFSLPSELSSTSIMLDAGQTSDVITLSVTLNSFDSSSQLPLGLLTTLRADDGVSSNNCTIGTHVNLCLGDGNLLKRSEEETCHACHKTDLNTTHDDPTYPDAIKSHNSANTGSAKWPNGWGVAGGKYGEFICTTCHTVHDTKNIYLIKESISATNSPTDRFPGDSLTFKKKSQDDLPNRGVSDGVMGDDSDNHSASTRVCEICHSRNRLHNYDSAGGTTHNNGADCTLCHSHKEGFKSPCGGCHNTPPSEGDQKHATHFGSGTAAYGDTSVQSTATAYSFNCGICHNGTHRNSNPSNPRTVEVSFAGLATQSGAITNAAYAPSTYSIDAPPGSSYTFTYSGGSCSNVYCHGNYPGSGKNAFPTFVSGSAPCGSCHGASNLGDLTPYGTTGVLKSGSHERHVTTYQTVEYSSVPTYNRGYACTLCHSATVSGGPPSNYQIIDKARHVNGSVDIAFDPNDSRVSPDDTAFENARYNISPWPQSPSDGSIRAYGTCTVYCHSNVQSGVDGMGGPTRYSNPTWGTRTFLSGRCNCHDANGHNGSSVISTGSHTKHLNFAGGSMAACYICHPWVEPACGAGCHNSNEQRLHVNGVVNVVINATWGDTARYNDNTATPGKPGNGFFNCSNVYCHNDGTSVYTGVRIYKDSPVWGTFSGCHSCHGNSYTTYSTDYRRATPLYVSGSPKPNAHDRHTDVRAMPSNEPQCLHCHRSTTTTNTSITGSTHSNGAYNVDSGQTSYSYYYDGDNIGGGYNQAVYMNVTLKTSSDQPDIPNTQAATTCSNVSCHPTGTAGSRAASTTRWDTRYTCTDCHSVKLGSTSGYHHVMNSDAILASSRDYPTSVPDGDGTNPESRQCTMCHVDHDIFSPMLNAVSLGGRAFNLRTDITVPPNREVWSEESRFANTDYVEYSNGSRGICLSCHNEARTKSTTKVKTEINFTKTRAISPNDYGTSTHNYSNVSTASTFISSDKFYANCSKCHNARNATETATFQSATGNRFSLHDSSVRRLLAPMGISSPSDPLEEKFCFRCHSKKNDNIGGTVKPSPGKDYYGQRDMSQAAEDIYAVFQKISPVSALDLYVNTLHFRASSEEVPFEPMPDGHATGDTLAGVSWIGRSMSPGSTPSALETKSQTTDQSGTKYWRMVTFTSPPIANDVTLQSGNWYISLESWNSDIRQNGSVRYMVYIWKSNDTIGDIIIPRTNMPLDTNMYGRTATVYVNREVSLSVGDKIVADFELMTAASDTASYTANYRFASSNAGYLSMPRGLLSSPVYWVSFLPKGGGHNVSAYSGFHKPSPSDETLSYISGNKHIECEDCHNVHAAGQTKHARGTNNVSPVIKGVSGVVATFSTDNWAAPVSYTLQTEADKEYQICFKCHSSANANYASWGGTGSLSWTDVGLEFNTGNNSFHPVAAPLPSGRQLAANRLSGGWSPGQTMYCTDCHDTDSTVSRGPHASKIKWMLAGINKAWPYTTASANGSNNYDNTMVYRTLNNAANNQGTGNGLFCLNCHQNLSGVSANSEHQNADQNTPCVSCHMRVPHGGKVSRLINTNSSGKVPRYAPDGNGGGNINYSNYNGETW